MSLTLNTNVSALSTQQYLNVNAANAAQSLQQLSSGSRLNSAADDPAGYSIAFKLGVKSASITTAVNNGNQALSMLQTAQGGITQIGNILTQLKQIATEAASSNTDTANLAGLNTQVGNLQTEINNIASATQYGGVALLQGGNVYTQTLAVTQAGIDSVNVSGATAGTYSLTAASSAGGVTLTLTNSTGTTSQAQFLSAATLATDVASGIDSTVNFSSFGISLQANGALTTLATTNVTVTVGASSFTYQVGSENQSYNQISASLSNFAYNGSVLNISGDVTTHTNAQAYMSVIDTAATNLNVQAGNIGAVQNEISYQVANLQSMNTNTQAAASTIKDTDYAAAMSSFAKNQVATQAGVAMLSQANQLPQQILSLIKNG